MTSELILSLSGRYAAAFGLLASAGKPDGARISGDYKLEFFGPENPEAAEISFTWEGNEIRFARMPFSNVEGIGNILAPPPIITFSRAKHLIETPVNGSDNVVVERWGTKQWEIRIAGLLIDVENRQYPKEYIRKLNRLFSYNGVVDVAGDQFEAKDIASVYFQRIGISPVPGYADTVKFTLTARSITPVGFTLENPNA